MCVFFFVIGVVYFIVLFLFFVFFCLVFRVGSRFYLGLWVVWFVLVWVFVFIGFIGVVFCVFGCCVGIEWDVRKRRRGV